ncbi:MAG: glycerate kinase [Bacteroidota bacterium]
MKIIVAPTSFKGSLSAIEATERIAEAVKRTLPQAEVVEFPLSDGGEGFVDTLVRGSGGRVYETEVMGPLPQQRVNARWGTLGHESVAIIEMAAAAGLSLVLLERRDPKLTTTCGVGQLIRAALGLKAEKIVIGLGGSATNDGGAGMAQALGARLLRKDGIEVGRGGAALLELHQIDISWLDRRIRQTKFIVASDVRNPLCGPRGASAVYGPQKGATRVDVQLLDRALEHYGSIIKRDIGVHLLEVAGAGAAGGLGAGCVAFLNATMQSGVEFVLNELKFDTKLVGASLIITGEGKVDEQTAYGKALTGIVQRARTFGIPVVAIAGSIEGDKEHLKQTLGLKALYCLRDSHSQPNQRSIQETMEMAKEILLEKAMEAMQEQSISS